MENPQEQAFPQTIPICIVGSDGFEPPKSKDSRFTVCPIWPLWKLPIAFLGDHKVTTFSRISKIITNIFSPTPQNINLHYRRTPYGRIAYAQKANDGIPNPGVCRTPHTREESCRGRYVIRILYGCRLVGDDDNPGLRFAYPGLYASPESRPHMLRMSSHPQP